MVPREIKLICNEARAYFLLRAPARESIEHIEFYKFSLALLKRMLNQNTKNPSFSHLEGVKARAMILSIEGLLKSFENGKTRKESTVYSPIEIFRFTACQSRHFFRIERDEILKAMMDNNEIASLLIAKAY